MNRVISLQCDASTSQYIGIDICNVSPILSLLVLSYVCVCLALVEWENSDSVFWQGKRCTARLGVDTEIGVE